jgi:hypothetical protein
MPADQSLSPPFIRPGYRTPTLFSIGSGDHAEILRVGHQPVEVLVWQDQPAATVIGSRIDLHHRYNACK